jgi:hypothetical protein
MDILDAVWSFHVDNGGDLLGVVFDAAIANDEAK